MYTTTFKTSTSAKLAADYINRPHEDYPQRINNTLYCITMVTRHLKASDLIVRSFILKTVHNIIMYDLPDRGSYRLCDVTINGVVEQPPNYIQVPVMMDQIVPVQFTSVDQLQDWYCQFETIHPFSDGNGRVGGVVLAAVSYQLTKRYMVDAHEAY